MSTTLVDAADRDRIARSHDETLFVQAGAGSGKTSALVARLVHLVLDGADLHEIAAITFSEAAAAELRARVRQTLEDVAAAEPVAHITAEVDDAGRRALAPRAEAALDALDGATICTLHAFAQRLLLAAPVEAQLPPRVDVHDELSSALRFQDRWARFEQSLLEDEELGPVVDAMFVLGIESTQLQGVAATLGDNWDLVEEADRSGALAAMRSRSVDLDLPADAWIECLRDLIGRRDECTAPSNGLLAWLDDDATRLLAMLEACRDDAGDLLALTKLDGLKAAKQKGKKTEWPDGVKEEICAQANRLFDEITTARKHVCDAVLTRLGAELAHYTLDDARARRDEGQLEFHDLLVLARALLRTDVGVRRRFHDRFRRLLIDEFQDTDPLQIEIAMRLAAAPDVPGDVAWTDLDVEPGRLFFVGDPKQSIYRFRRADIDLFEQTAARHVDGQANLDVNFRTVAPVLDFCNQVFDVLIGPERRLDESDRVAQPAYRALQPHRERLPDDPGPAVLVLEGVHELVGPAKDAEAGAVAAALAQAEDEGWLVEPAGESPRPCRWSDMTILVPSRATLGVLRAELDERGVPYRIESGTLVYGTTEVNDLLAAIAAIDDPGDEIAVTGALRSAMYGCGDDDLHRWVDGGRHLRYLGPHVRDDAALEAARAAGESVDPVEAALADLRRRHRASAFQSVPEVVEGLIAERGLLALGLLAGDHRDVWRLYRVVTEHARQFADTETGGLRAFLRWVRLQRDDKVRAHSPVIPEADVEAVRIMTIHGAKGLEFGITAVSGLAGQDPKRANGPTVLFRTDGGGFDIRMRMGMETARFERARLLEDTMDVHERIRLLYVALTRARDHLIVSAHHKRVNKPSSHGARIAGVLADLDAAGVPAACTRSSATDDLPEGGSSRAPAAAAAQAVSMPPPPEPAATRAWLAAERDWLAHRHAAWTSHGRVVSATALAQRAHGDGPDPATDGGARAEPEREPWRRGRGGTEVGSAVHAVLQHADLDRRDPDQIAALARWQAGVEGVPDAAAEIERTAGALLDSALVARALASPRWRREVHVSAPVDRILGAQGDDRTADQIEGFVDLLFEDGDGLVVVDYKTDAIAGDADLTRALERHTPQGAAYALALEAATGRPVTEVHFLFVRGDDAVDAPVVDLGSATDAVRASLTDVEGDGS